eukprot:Clim_evm38s88 gene=Clim_evmTU38s88
MPSAEAALSSGVQRYLSTAGEATVSQHHDLFFQKNDNVVSDKKVSSSSWFQEPVGHTGTTQDKMSPAATERPGTPKWVTYVAVLSIAMVIAFMNGSFTHLFLEQVGY